MSPARRELPRLMLIANAPTHDAERVAATLAKVFDAIGGAEIIVYDRDHSHAPDGERLARLTRLRDLTRRAGAWLVVGGRPDLAVAADAEGVQLPERGLPAEIVARAWPGLSMGRSCHDRSGLQRAAAAGCRWATLAPVRAPWSKAASDPPLGVEGFREAVAGVDLPVFALGGVGADIATRLRHAGAWGLATIGWVFGATDPAARTRALLPPA